MTMPDGSQTPPPQPFRATPRAHRQIAEIAAREGRPRAGLRLAVEAGGCSGLQYKFELADEPEAGDTVVLFGDHRLGVPTAQDWAEAAGTISYEITTRLGARVPRVYLNDEENPVA